MLALQYLRSDHAAAVLAFETSNRRYFAASVSDRGDEFFERFFELFDDLLDEQAAGTCILHVLVDQDGAVVGRFNLYTVEGETAEVGYRVAEHSCGHGVATSTLRELCNLAAQHYGIRRLGAVVRDENIASRRVLEKVGFVSVGPVQVARRPGTLYQFATGETAPA